MLLNIKLCYAEPRTEHTQESVDLSLYMTSFSYIHTYIFIFNTYIYMYMCVYISVYACVYIYVHVYTYMHAHIHIHAYTRKIPLRIPSFLFQRHGSEESLQCYQGRPLSLCFSASRLCVSALHPPAGSTVFGYRRTPALELSLPRAD